jgi:hypothetical protein
MELIFLTILVFLEYPWNSQYMQSRCFPTEWYAEATSKTLIGKALGVIGKHIHGGCETRAEWRPLSACAEPVAVFLLSCGASRILNGPEAGLPAPVKQRLGVQAGFWPRIVPCT